MAAFTTEPTNGLSHSKCGGCDTWFQVKIPVLDENNNPTYNDQGEQIFTTDDVAGNAELHQHDAENHVWT